MNRIHLVWIIGWIVLASAGLYSSTYYVSHSLPGTFATIQAAIDASVDGDSVLVYPGIYTENLSIETKSITLISVEPPIVDRELMPTVTIDGNQSGGCIFIRDCTQTRISGFFLTNGSGVEIPNGFNQGGGMLVQNSSLVLENCLVKANSASMGSGIYLDQSDATLSGTTISNNHSTYCGAMSIASSTVEFDSNNLCSIYANYASTGNDIAFNTPIIPNIILDKFTLLQPNDEYIYSAQMLPYTFSCLRAEYEPLEADLFVDTEGDDQNSGLSPDQPLKTIALALIKVQADSLNPRTIHLANGTYSHSLNGQFFPLNLKSYVTIEGESETGTIIDGDNKFTAASGLSGEREMSLRNLTIQHCTAGYRTNSDVLSFFPRWNGQNTNQTKYFTYTLENLTFRDCLSPPGTQYTERLMLIINSNQADRAILKNINILDCSGRFAISISGYNTYAEDILIDNYQSGNINSTGCPILICHNGAYDAVGSPNYFVNIQITNSFSNEQLYPHSAMFYVGGNYTNDPPAGENYLINSTITQNICRWGNGGAIVVMENGNLTVINSIVYNNSPRNLRMSSINNQSCRVRMVNSLIGTGEYGTPGIQNLGANNILEWYGSNPTADPLFNSENAVFPYSLSNGSPCIDAGWQDLNSLNMGIDADFPLTDITGLPRIYNNLIDIGAYEYQGVSNQQDVIPIDDSKPNLKISPSPFSTVSEISFNLKDNRKTELCIYNMKGQRVRRLTNGNLTKGNQSFSWNGRDDRSNACSTGIYFVRLQLNGKVVSSRKVTLVK